MHPKKIVRAQKLAREHAKKAIAEPTMRITVTYPTAEEFTRVFETAYLAGFKAGFYSRN